MKRTSNWVMALLVLMISVTGVMAQKNRPAPLTDEQRAERMAQRMTQELSLDENQTKQIEQIYQKHFAQAKKAEQERQQRMQQMKDQINEVLTAEQREQWEKKQAEMRERMKSRKPSPNRERPVGPCPGMEPASEGWE